MIHPQRALPHLTAVLCLLVFAGCHLRPLNSVENVAVAATHTVRVADFDVPDDEPTIMNSHRQQTAACNSDESAPALVLVRHAKTPSNIMTVGFDSAETNDDGHVWVTSQWSLANPHTDDLGNPEPQEELNGLDWSTAAYPDERPLTLFLNDVRNLPHDLWDDTKSIVTWKNALVLGAGAGLAVGLRQHTDHEAREYVKEHPLRWGAGSKIFRIPGDPQYQVPVLAGVYTYSLFRQDPEFHNFMRTTVSSYSIAALSTVALKGITNTRRPSDEFLDGRWGFPSGHVSTCFAVSATIDEYYGWPAALPAYVLSGLVGWSRIDQREHDVSDVVFGSLMGYVIGHSVARTRLNRDGQFQIEPWVDPLDRGGGAGGGVQMVIPY